MGDAHLPGERRRRRRRALRNSVAAAAVTTALALSLSAVPTQAQAPSPSAEELKHQLDERDAVIADLLRRVEALERAAGQARAQGTPGGVANVAAAPVPPASSSSAAQVAQAAPAAPSPAAPGNVVAAAAPVAAPPNTQPGAPAPQNTQTAQGGTPPPSGAPGQFAVDEEAAERALERTLVATGALLLPANSFEVQPSVQYGWLEADAPVLVTQDGVDAIGQQRVRTEAVQAALALRYGLPWESQIEFNIPYNWRDVSTVTSTGFSDLLESRLDGDGWGDLGVALSKVLMREKGRRPDVIAALNWNTTTGETDGNFRFGSDFDELGVSLTAVKRADPLVWVGTLSYENTFEAHDITPGDQIGLSLGAVLAVTPTTSLRFNIDQNWVSQTKFRGNDVPGSDTTVSTLNLGASAVLTKRVLLDVQVGVGLTEAAPDYTFGIALPIRFDSLF
ncbi:transporter [Caulobacter sp. 17J80-11]|uniref:transporter n=1 Tax=Caulobacter sp. 17J80-11 TaxID=2763502 RepID=UPI001653D548|nr:transporter [Caulobacter sp. 17J80-11]MBC6980523.1 transporter [Caulobacter sp. 17J80-11]